MNIYYGKPGSIYVDGQPLDEIVGQLDCDVETNKKPSKTKEAFQKSFSFSCALSPESAKEIRFNAIRQLYKSEIQRLASRMGACYKTKRK
jgi:hypothetical protein